MAEPARHTGSVSVVLPVHNQADHIGGVVEGYLNVMRRLGLDTELGLVANACTDSSIEVCEALTKANDEVRMVELSLGGWGRAVQAGLACASGDLLGYANSARNSPEILALMISYARAYPEVVLKANRRIRDSIVRRVGSLLYNLECRALFDMPTWDVNGTPKFFPRSFGELLELRSTGDLIDAEFMAACKRADYSIIEVPLLATTRLGGRSTTNLRSASRMYSGAAWMRMREGHR